MVHEGIPIAVCIVFIFKTCEMLRTFPVTFCSHIAYYKGILYCGVQSQLTYRFDVWVMHSACTVLMYRLEKN